MSVKDISDYYDRRAGEYEAIYRKPERQADLARLESWLLEFCRARTVLEIACGTGYWTERIARAARAVTAFDRAPATLAVADAREYPAGRVRLRTGDAWRLEDQPGPFNAVVAGFFWSHIPRREIPLFLDGLLRRFPEGVSACFFDNRYVEGSSTPISRRDAHGNSYQERTLADGSRHELIKNFPSPEELAASVRGRFRTVEIRLLDHYWVLTGETEPAAEPAPDQPEGAGGDLFERR